MGFLVSFIVKIFSRAHVDFRLIGGLFIVFLLTVMKVFLELRMGEFLPGVTPDVLFGLMITVLFITAIILVYWQYSVPFLGASFSALIVLSMLFGVSYGVPKLSIKLMPEGQRFAEYAGFASEQTSQLMEQAKNFKKKGDGATIWQKALAALSFFTSDQEKENLSRDFAAGIEVYKERKALMDSMSDEELDEYRKAMSQFLEEQGLAENRYSLSNLKNVQPEDLANLGSFMKELNGEFGIEEEFDESIPDSAESIRNISLNLQSSKLSGRDKEIFNRLIELVGSDDLEEGLAKARAEIVELKKELPAGDRLFSNALKFEISKPNFIKRSKGEERIEIIDETIKSQKKLSDAAEIIDLKLENLTINKSADEPVVLDQDRSKYTNEKVGVWVLQLPPTISNIEEWEKVAEAIPYRAWFEGKGAHLVTKLILDDIVLSAGDSWQFKYKEKVYVFQFDKVTMEGIFIAAVKRL